MRISDWSSDVCSSDLETTRINLGRTVIRSPVDGVVLTRTIEPGQTVAASLQAPELFTIAEDLSKMKIELAFDESDIGQVRAGQSVSFPDYPLDRKSSRLNSITNALLVCRRLLEKLTRFSLRTSVFRIIRPT